MLSYIARWKKQGLEAMLFDDGMEVEDLESLDASKDHVTLSDLMDALETKYDLLREKLLLEMAHLSSGLCQQFVVYLLNLVNLSRVKL